MRPFFLLSLYLVSSASFGGPPNPKDYLSQNGGFIELFDGSYVEGSAGSGGIQPDYFIDLESPEFRSPRKFAREIGARADLNSWEKIQTIGRYVHEQLLVDGSYVDEKYLNLLSHHRTRGENVPLSKYLSCQAGVCRENGMTLHLLLKEAGIPNLYLYVKAEQLGRSEDHGLTVFLNEGNLFVADSYNSRFHGHRLEDLMAPSGIASPTEFSLPGIDTESMNRRIIKIQKYPMTWTPKKRSATMAEFFEKQIKKLKAEAHSFQCKFLFRELTD